MANSREGLRAIRTANPDPIVVRDARKEADFINPEFQRQFAGSASELANWSFHFLDQPSQKAMKALVRGAMAGEGPPGWR